MSFNLAPKCIYMDFEVAPGIFRYGEKHRVGLWNRIVLVTNFKIC